jgi:hypothetical protein
MSATPRYSISNVSCPKTVVAFVEADHAVPAVLVKDQDPACRYISGSGPVGAVVNGVAH